MLAPDSDIDLLFLRPYKQTARGESVIEYMLYALWDLGFKVGHATRTIDQCVRLSHSDITIRTSILEARLIPATGAVRRVRAALPQRGGRGQARAVRRRQAGGAERAPRPRRRRRYLVEPNIKEGKGGLRDLHTLYWIAKHLYPDKAEAEFVEAGMFTPQRRSRLPSLRELPVGGARPAALPHRAA